VGVSPDGSRTFVAGSADGDGRTDGCLIAYDTATGAVLWSATYAGPHHAEDRFSQLAISPDGSSVYVTGGTDPQGEGPSWYTAAYATSTGARRWIARRPGLAARDLALSPDGSRVYVVGNGAVVAYGAATGNQIWTASPDLANLVAVGVGTGGRIALAASTRNDIGAGALSARGAILWTRVYRGFGSDSDRAADLAVSPDGTTAYVAGYSDGLDTSLDFTTIAYDLASGARLWLSRMARDSWDRSSSIAVDPDGEHVVVAGNVQDVYGYDHATLVSYRSTDGSEQWRSVARGWPRSDTSVSEGDAVAVGSDGTVYLTGFGIRRPTPGGPSEGGYRTTAHAAADGSVTWTSWYPDPDPTIGSWEARDLVLTSSGTLIVTGENDGDLATVAYGTV
jgi:hypothetical protein